MKKIIWMSLILGVSMLLIPFSVLGTAPKAQTVANMTVPKTDNTEENKEAGDTFRILNHKTEEITEMKSSDYIFGVVAAEMPALYETEAIKAQAVAAYTYACYNRNANSNRDYDLSTDFNVSQSFITEADAKEKWGSNAEKYTEKIKDAIKEVDGYLIKYNGEAILSVYHAISSGKTEDSSNVWGNSYPYLKSVDSSFDKNANNYSTETVFTSAQLKDKLGDKINSKYSPDDYFGDCSLSKTGLVKEIELCGKNITGAKLRELLDLRSSNFQVDYKDGNFTFTTYGYGHGVGMSQNGANELAKQGKNFEEILIHYYTDCTVEK